MLPKNTFLPSAQRNENTLAVKVFIASSAQAYGAHKICYASRAPETHTDLYLPTSAAE